MAQITLRVPSFDIDLEIPATSEDDVWDQIDVDELGQTALDKAFVLTAVYSKPELEDNSSDEEEESKDEN